MNTYLIINQVDFTEQPMHLVLIDRNYHFLFLKT